MILKKALRSSQSSAGDSMERNSNSMSIIVEVYTKYSESIMKFEEL